MLDDTITNRPTSLSSLSDHDWQILRSRWARGADWCLSKVGRRWSLDAFLGMPWPHFRTKRAAISALNDLICAESHHRAALAAHTRA